MRKVRTPLLAALLGLFAFDVFSEQIFAQKIVDDNYVDCCFQMVGTWTKSSATAGYYGTGYRWTAAGDGSRSATFKFSITAAGVFEIAGWWATSPNQAYNAPFTIYNNGVSLGTALMDQRKGSGIFNPLGVYALESGTLQVTLRDTPAGEVVADAMKISYLGESVLKISSPRNLDVKSLQVQATAQPLRFPAGWGVDFVLDGTQTLRASSAPYQCTFANVSKAEHVLEAYMVDQTGTRQPAYYDRVTFGVGDYYVAFGDSITKGSHDDISDDNVSKDGRNIGTGYAPVLNDLLTAAKEYPHTVVREGVSGNTSLDGLTRLPSVLAVNPDSKYFLICFGRNDSFPTGKGLRPGDTGYSGSYKDYMQQIITALLEAGKVPLVSKVPLVLAACAGCATFPDPDTAPDNLLIKDYNLVIDELLAANRIPVAPPDFYAYFSTHTSEFASDRLHFNGVGYRSWPTCGWTRCWHRRPRLVVTPAAP